MSTFELSPDQVDSIRTFIDKTVDSKESDEWTALILDAVDACNDNASAIAVVEQMLSLLDMEDPDDLDLSVEYILAALALTLAHFTPLFNAALKEVKLQSFPGITKVRNAFRQGQNFGKQAKAGHAPGSKGRLPTTPATPATSQVAEILTMLQSIQQKQDNQGAAIAQLQHQDSDSESESEEDTSDDDQPDPMQAVLAAVQDIKHKMNLQSKEIKTLQSGKKALPSKEKYTLDDSNEDPHGLLSAKAIKEMSSPMSLTHPMVHYRYDSWPVLAKGGSTDRQVLLRTLKEAFQCSQSRLNHQRDVLMELLDYALQKDYKSLIKLIGDRSHFLSFLDEHTLQESTHYWHQLRQDERPQRFRAAETSTMLMGQRVSHQHAAHLTKQLGLSDDLGDDQQGGGYRRGDKKKKKQKPHGKKGKKG